MMKWVLIAKAKGFYSGQTADQRPSSATSFTERHWMVCPNLSLPCSSLWPGSDYNN